MDVALHMPRVGSQSPVREGRSAQWWIALAAVLCSSAVMIARALGATNPVDFFYLLSAGRMWGAGLDPYGPTFAIAGADLLPADALPFPYPPTWWLIAVPLGALKTGNAVLAWKALSLLAAGAAAALLVRSAARLTQTRSPWPATLAVACLFASDVTGVALRLGQSTLIVLLGFALLISGLTDKRRWLQVAGLAVLLFKPQIGLLFLFLLAIRRETRPAAALAIVAAAIACLPLLFTLGVAATVESAGNLLQSVDAYDMSPWNSARHTSGLPHLFAYAGINLPPLAALLAAGALAAWLLRRGPQEGQGFVVSFWLVSLGALLSIVSLHAYDFVLFFTCLLLLPALDKRVARNLLILSLVLTWSAVGVGRMAFAADPSVEGFWVAARLKCDLLTAGGFALLAAAVCQLRPALVAGWKAKFLAFGAVSPAALS